MNEHNYLWVMMIGGLSLMLVASLALLFVVASQGCHQ